METEPNNFWHLYMIRCGDGSLYTGITLDLNRRFREHQEQGAKCAKYLRGRLPLELLYTEGYHSKQEALRAEIRVKNLSKHQKESLVAKQS
jgi:putative endonuclease